VSTDETLKAVYEEMMWLAKRPDVSASLARSWYTHVRSGGLRLTRFSGKVSRAALNPKSVLRLEHYRRIQTGLTQLVERHRKLKRPNAAEFIRFLRAAERVHIVTFRENYEALKAKGKYKTAGIELVPWSSLAAPQQERLWRTMLRGRVSNANTYKPIQRRR
jgi:hypothetical protein